MSETRPPRRRILIVEDESMVRMLLEDMLDDLGYEIADVAGGIDEAIVMARQGKFDAAILDVNIDGQSINPVAAVLAERGVPFVITTGYGRQSIPESYRNRPTLQKPFQQDSLGRALAGVLGCTSA